MVNILLISLLVHYVLFLIFKGKGSQGVLGCGIFAWAGDNAEQFNEFKFDILGIINETRGEHSCGVTAEGEIRVGVDQFKVYRDFIAAGDTPRPINIPATIGHTRHATVGSHSMDNAHPFGFGDANEGNGYAFVGVHNGTLLNHAELGRKYGVDVMVGLGTKNVRSKVDSEILLEIIYKTGDFKVLSQYNGAAALIFQFLEEPDVVYFYHGKSSYYEDSSTPLEERPLYYFKEGKNSMYVSSIENSLFAIGGDSETVEEFDHNTVYKVTKGDIENAEKYTISRATNFQKRGSYNHTGSNNYTPRMAASKSEKKGKTPSTSSKTSGDEVNIYGEKPMVDLKKYGGRVYFNKLRYWRNGHKIDGVWTLVKGYGFYYLGHNMKHAESTFWSYTNKYFCNGGFYTKEQLTKEQLENSFIPFKHGGKHNEIMNPPLYSFYKGIMMEHYLDFVGCINKDAIGREFSIAELSTMAKHPIMSHSYETRLHTFQRIFYEGKLYTGTVCPLESNRTYTIRGGNLISTVDLLNSEKNVSNNLLDEIEEIDVTKSENLEERLESLRAEVMTEKEKKEEFQDEEVLEDDITKMFAHAYDNFPRYKAQLEKYGDNKRAMQAIGIITTFLAASYDLLTLESKE